MKIISTTLLFVLLNLFFCGLSWAEEVPERVEFRASSKSRYGSTLNLEEIAAAMPKNTLGYPREQIMEELENIWGNNDTAKSKQDWLKYQNPRIVFPPVMEDPDWYYADTKQAEKQAWIDGAALGSGYLRLVNKALEGNAAAMGFLMHITRMYGDLTYASYPNFPLAMHTMDFWYEWAARYTSPGWPYARMAEYLTLQGEGIGFTGRPLGNGTNAGDPESTWVLSDGHDMPLVLRAAKAGFGQAAARMSALYRGGYDEYSFLIQPDQEKHRHYLELGMRAGDRRAFAYAAYNAFVGAQGEPQDLETFYTYMLIAKMLSAAERVPDLGKFAGQPLKLLFRPIPELPDYTPVYVRSFLNSAISEQSLKTDFTDMMHDKVIYIYETQPEIFELSPELKARAMARAKAWVNTFKAEQEAILTAERQRRAKLTLELQKECAPAVAYIAERKAAYLQREAERERLRKEALEKEEFEKKMIHWLKTFILPGSILLAGLGYSIYLQYARRKTLPK